MPSSGALPPSVEKAYYRKCIELRRRINEIEEHNDATRLRIKRLNRSVLKMRLERAFLLEQLQQRMDYNVDHSDNSTSPPPTVSSLAPPQPPDLPLPRDNRLTASKPQDKPLRSKRSHRKTTPTGAPPSSQQGAASPPPSSSHHSHAHALAPHVPLSSAHSTPDPSGRMRSEVFYPPTSEFAAAVNGSRPIPPTNQYEPSPAAPGTLYDERRSVSTAMENGGDRGHSGRGYAAGTTGSDVRTDANGERRVARDEEMADAEAPREAGALGGFTAVNR
ncbi:hypothetical protein EJ05DRAFT_482124 [Pseudovirgaria hyperparasitica]|uniref:INO80 complex subunit F domain-containing protein n=1 Tax=Pseudovirgaria hyperparasitica TaxID=470096 RepID=A0A6A6WMR1_9PEZI|nr:uncharacterized protein EJ05DRAFT_482124 [Pseudovirgaria hyperparasitica]KAF2763309.1 hypothetical protein EJ05DRAFT_482124 [Pseudovirgaria hyperparasitica]